MADNDKGHAPPFPATEKNIDLLLEAPLQLRLENDQIVVQALTVEAGTATPVTINVRFSSVAGGQLLSLLGEALQAGVLGTRTVKAPTLQ